MTGVARTIYNSEIKKAFFLLVVFVVLVFVLYFCVCSRIRVFLFSCSRLFFWFCSCYLDPPPELYSPSPGFSFNPPSVGGPPCEIEKGLFRHGFTY